MELKEVVAIVQRLVMPRLERVTLLEDALAVLVLTTCYLETFNPEFKDKVLQVAASGNARTALDKDDEAELLWAYALHAASRGCGVSTLHAQAVSVLEGELGLSAKGALASILAEVVFATVKGEEKKVAAKLPEEMDHRDYRTTGMMLWISGMACPALGMPFPWAAELRRHGMTQVWPVFRRAYLSQPKETRNASELWLALGLAVAEDSPRDYGWVSNNVLDTWRQDAIDGVIARDLQLVYCLSIVPGVAWQRYPKLLKRIFGGHPILMTLFAGTRDPQSPLSSLRRFEKTLLPMIWDMVCHSARECLKYPKMSAVRVAENVPFPARSPEPINVNMMPIRYGDVTSVPKHLRQYLPLIQACHIPSEESYSVMYLTVHESLVDPNATQRREGLHVETPGVVSAKLRIFSGYWGNGYEIGHTPYGGIYFGSNVSDSCALYPEDLVVDPEKCVGRHGDCESLRGFLHKRVLLRGGELWWMTDRTPHEAVPVAGAAEPYWRQFFRLVRGKISVWYSMHSTPNPRVPLPEDVTVIDTDKFA